MAETTNTENNNNNNFKDDWALKIIAIVMAIGASAIFFVSLFTAFKGNPQKGFWPVLGLSLGIGLAAMVAGGFFGFLFGIPKSQQRNSLPPLPTPPPTERNGTNQVAPASSQNRPYGGNTNLEEISDWLTKIIVGVSLIQLTKIIHFYNKSCNSLAKSFKNYLDTDFAFTYSGSLLIFFSICGFLIVYLWSRLYFVRQLNLTTAEELLEKVDHKLNNVNTEQNKKRELAILERKIEEFSKERNKIILQESDPEIKAILDIAKPNPITILNDCQKNRWGGLTTVNDYYVTPTVVQDTLDNEKFHVTLEVGTKNVDASPLNGDVYFFIHESYTPSIVKQAAQNNAATLKLESYEAFTIGIVFNGGNTKLEIDLNTIDGIPEGYKYPDKLDSIDELKAKQKALEEQ